MTKNGFLARSHLAQIIKILQHRNFPAKIMFVTFCCFHWKILLKTEDSPEEQPVRDGLAHHEGGDEVLDRSGLPTVGTKHKGVHAALAPQVVQHRDVGVHVVDVVRVRRILAVRPFVRGLRGNRY